MGREDGINMRLVEDNEFIDASLSDASDDDERIDLNKFRATKNTFNTMSGFTQVMIFFMFWSIMLGMCMLAMHIVARDDPNRLTVIFVSLSSAWIILSNLLAIVIFITDKYQACNSQHRISEALVHTLLALGGIPGGWIALCLTCYKPPGLKKDRISGFICRAMIFSALGLTIVIVLLLKVLLPNLQILLT